MDTESEDLFDPDAPEILDRRSSALQCSAEFEGRFPTISMQLKRVLDLLIVLVLSPLWVPLITIIAFMVRFQIGHPVLFTQKRPGYRGRIFTVYKFRTMTNDRDSSGALLSDARRLTAFGRWLRQTSLDELPEIWNVLRGEMSLVGPRPLLVEYLDRYSAEQKRRHDVLPGLTGWAQINGRNALSWDEKFRLDLWYVDHQNFFLDCRILLLSLRKVLSREGVNAPGSATMPEFKGNSENPPSTRTCPRGVIE